MYYIQFYIKLIITVVYLFRHHGYSQLVKSSDRGTCILFFTLKIILEIGGVVTLIIYQETNKQTKKKKQTKHTKTHTFNGSRLAKMNKYIPHMSLP